MDDDSPCPPHRLFVALPIPDVVKADLREVVQELHIARQRSKRSLKHSATEPFPLNQDQWHLTVAFIGKASCADIARVRSALQRTAARFEPFPLAVAGGGRFGRGRFSVVWAGVDGHVEQLVDLAAHARTELEDTGLNPDSKQFRPHITLARPGDRVTNQQASQDLLTLRRYRGPTWTADELVLFDSNYGHQPTGESPTYAPLATVRLGTQ